MPLESTALVSFSTTSASETLSKSNKVAVNPSTKPCELFAGDLCLRVLKSGSVSSSIPVSKAAEGLLTAVTPKTIVT